MARGRNGQKIRHAQLPVAMAPSSKGVNVFRPFEVVSIVLAMILDWLVVMSRVQVKKNQIKIHGSIHS